MKIIDLNERLEDLEYKIKGWQKQMQNPNLETYVFIKYSKIVSKLGREKKYLLKLLQHEMQ